MWSKLLSNQIIVKSNHACFWSNHQIKSSNQAACTPLLPPDWSVNDNTQMILCIMVHRQRVTSSSLGWCPPPKNPNKLLQTSSEIQTQCTYSPTFPPSLSYYLSTFYLMATQLERAWGEDYLTGKYVSGSLTARCRHIFQKYGNLPFQ